MTVNPAQITVDEHPAPLPAELTGWQRSPGGHPSKCRLPHQISTKMLRLVRVRSGPSER